MSDKQGLTLAEIVHRLGGELCGDASVRISQVATLSQASSGQISFLAHSKYRSQLASTGADAIVLAPDAAGLTDKPRIVSNQPYLYFARLSSLLNPQRRPEAGVHNSATVESVLPASVTVSAGARIGKGCTIGERVVVGPNCVIGDGARIGSDSFLHANVSIYFDCEVGERAILHSGAVIGSDGFGFAPEPGGSWQKIPQIGKVILGDDVEVGANTCIDRGALGDTVIGNGVKLDNLIQIAHNVKIGENTAIAACVGVAGSAVIGKRCAIGGAASILGHLELADDVRVSAGTLVPKSLTQSGTYTGVMPVEPHRDWLKNAAHLRRLDKMATTLRNLEKKFADLEKKS